MPRTNRVETVKVGLSLDPATNQVLDELATIGLFGKNKSEVGSTIIRMWTWDNEEKLTRHGINLVKAGSKPAKGFRRGNQG
jgi:hypothetical protein